MPSGALLDLVAHGVQDIYLIGNPEMTYFKSVYKRHSNFAMESVLGTLDGTPDFGQRLVCKVPRSGDLLSTVVLEVDLPQLTSTTPGDDEHTIQYIPNIGYSIIQYVELRIGGQQIDRQYGEWMYIWNELTKSDEKKRALDVMVRANPSNGPMTLMIPLEFWFCRNIGNSLPLVALQYHDVEIEIQLRPLSQLYYFGPTRFYDLTHIGNGGIGQLYTRNNGLIFSPSVNGKTLNYSATTGSQTIAYIDPDTISVAALIPVGSTSRVYITPNLTLAGTPSIQALRIFLDYIYLDTYERKWFAKSTHRYLIEQTQFSGSQGITDIQNSINVPVAFNLPVKELFWITQTTENLGLNQIMNFTSTPDPYYELAQDDIFDLTIQYNGSQRFTTRRGVYFRLLHPYQHHTNPVPDKYIYCYSFALRPEELQPSGASNYSRIDNVSFVINLRSGHLDEQLRIYGLNYNVLRIMNGMGGVAFTT
jgi:hypothetical protein